MIMCPMSTDGDGYTSECMGEQCGFFTRSGNNRSLRGASLKPSDHVNETCAIVAIARSLQRIADHDV